MLKLFGSLVEKGDDDFAAIKFRQRNRRICEMNQINLKAGNFIQVPPQKLSIAGIVVDDEDPEWRGKSGPSASRC